MNKILEVKHLFAGYGEQKVIEDVSFDLKEGEILGIVGESGSGKSTLLKALLNPKEYGVRIMNGEALYGDCDLFSLSDSGRRKLYGTEITMVFQNPASSFNPIRTYRKQFQETLQSHGLWKREDSTAQILKVFEKMNLKDGERILDSCPYELSGGMNQRVGIVLATMLNPRLFFADEPTSALDVTVQAQVVRELLDIHEKMKNTMILITHIMGVAAKMCDRIAVMYQGRIVECRPAAELLKDPKDPYTRELLLAVPKLGKRKREVRG